MIRRVKRSLGIISAAILSLPAIAAAPPADLTARALADSCSSTDVLNVNACEFYLFGFWQGGKMVGSLDSKSLFCNRPDGQGPTASSLRDLFMLSVNLHPDLLDRSAAVVAVTAFQIGWPCK